MNRVTAEDIVKYKEELKLEDEENWRSLEEAVAEWRMLWLEEAIAQGIITPASAKKIIENTEYQEVLYPIVCGLLREKK